MDDVAKNKLSKKFKDLKYCKVMVTDIDEKLAKRINEGQLD
jgi:hypothetical protein